MLISRNIFRQRHFHSSNCNISQFLNHFFVYLYLFLWHKLNRFINLLPNKNKSCCFQEKITKPSILFKCNNCLIVMNIINYKVSLINCPMNFIFLKFLQISCLFYCRKCKLLSLYDFTQLPQMIHRTIFQSAFHKARELMG